MSSLFSESGTEGFAPWRYKVKLVIRNIKEKSYYSQNKNEIDFEQVDKINGNELIEMMNMQE